VTVLHGSARDLASKPRRAAETRNFTPRLRSRGTDDFRVRRRSITLRTERRRS
jgi:hypothetical protein